MQHLFADGGVILKNPSPFGGTFAWRIVERYGGFDTVIACGSGLVLPFSFGLVKISNNITELVAVIEALEAQPEGWSGMIFTDSLVTIRRVMMTTKKPPVGIPDMLLERMKNARLRAGPIGMELLGGHPSKAELAAGVRKDRTKVSIHNVWCDERCSEIAAEHVKTLGVK